MRCFLLLLLAVSSAAQPKRIAKPKEENKEANSQTLPVQKDPPAAVTAEAARLTFQVSPLSDKGLLTPQMREALKAVMQSNHGGALVKLRAFVAGTGDLHRVQTVLSEAYGGKKEPLPALSIVQVGALPLEGAQVVLEAVSEDRRSVNSNGVTFVSGPLAQIEASGGDLLQLSCFLSSIDSAPSVRAALEQKFPHAALDLVQPLRENTAAAPVCEGVAAASQGGNAGKLVFTGLQLAFGGQDADLRLAFERLGKTLEAQGASYASIVHADLFALDRGPFERSGAVERELIPSNTHQLVENLPSIDASAGIEAVAAVRK